jgi:hypothetical protein
MDFLRQHPEKDFLVKTAEAVSDVTNYGVRPV